MTSSSKVFVTGSTGFIGSKLVEALIQQRASVRALTRSTSLASNPSPHPQLEYFHGDISDLGSIMQGMEGCQRVFHLAAYAKNWSPTPETFFEQNVQGTRNVLDAAAEHQVHRIVYTSTIVTMGPTLPGIVGNEEMPRSTQHFFTEYERTKTIAENEALERAREGLPVVIVNPTRVYGPGKLSEGNSVTKLFQQHSRGQLPVLLNGGVEVGNYVHVDDLVQGHLLAMERGRIGERYILGGENISLKELLSIVASYSDQTHFQLKLNPWPAIQYAKFLEFIATWFGIYPAITPGWVRTFLTNWVYESTKAERELGYRSRPLREGIKETMAWLR